MQLQSIIERIILYSRYILVVFYIGLALALGIYAAFFLVKLSKMAQAFISMDETEVLLAMLKLIDATLVAGLVVMVMLSSYDNFVSRLEGAEEGRSIGWLGRLDPGSLKIKLASAIVAISSIHLLAVFMNAGQLSNDDIYWKVIIHIVFIGSALFLGVLDRMTVIWRDKDASNVTKPK